MIKIRRKGTEIATHISYSCDGECFMSAALTRRAREAARTAADDKFAELMKTPGHKPEDEKDYGEELRAAIQAADAIVIECPQKGSHLVPWRSDPSVSEFSVSAVIASAAVEEGHFEVIPEQQTKLKRSEVRDQKSDQTSAPAARNTATEEALK